jgi:hypothetical protein
MDTKFCPPTWCGIPKDFKRFDVYPWIKDVPNNKKIFCAFWCDWQTPALPPGFDYYLITYHIENVDINWLEKQQQQVGGKFIVLFPGNAYNYHIDNTIFLSYIPWHTDIDNIIKWHGIQSAPYKKKFKYSAVCNRVTQSKIWVTTKLLESAADVSLILINNWIEEKDIHEWQKTNNKVLDNLTDTYLSKYKNLKISDDFNPQTDNFQKINSNPWQAHYIDTALHFTNNSFHYSFMYESGKEYIYPGPDLDEKTLKCLVAGVPFIACGQFEIYKTLSDLGLNFDYEFDLSWDQDQYTLSRFHGIINLIDYLNTMSIDDITQSTRIATKHNLEYVQKRGFYSTCEFLNQQSLEALLDNIT